MSTTTALLFDRMIARFLDASAIPDSLDVIDVSGRTPSSAEYARAEALVTPRLDRSVLDKCPKLEFIQVPGAGTDGIPFNDLQEDVVVAVTGHHGRSMAEYVLMAMILIGRRFISQDRALRRGLWRAPQWADDGAEIPDTLSGQTVVIIGMGEIGCEVARLSAAFGMNVVGVQRSLAHEPRYAIPEETELIEYSELENALAVCDHLVLAVPLSESTRGLIGGRELAIMKPSATLINVARGPIVDSQALFEALESNLIGGTALDVWYHYPEGSGPANPADEDFAAIDQLLMTPHTSGITRETYLSRAEAVLRNLARFSARQTPSNVVWPRT